MPLELTSALLGKTLDFDTHAPAILGSRIKGAKLLSILDASTAKQLDPEITTTHVMVYPYLPDGTPDNPTKYTYVRLMLTSGETKILGIPWIKESSITVVETTQIVVNIKGRNHEDIAQVRKALIASGFEDFTIEVTV